MHTRAKHPKALHDVGFGRFNLNDVDVTIDGGIHNKLKNTTPPTFISRLKTLFGAMSEKDPHKQRQAIPKLRKLAMDKTAGREFKILIDLESLFFPTEFSKYVDVLRDFKYSDYYK